MTQFAARLGLREKSMRVWIGIKEGRKLLHEWVGDVSKKGDFAKVTRQAVTDFVNRTGKTMYGKTLAFDKFKPEKIKSRAPVKLK
jgi:hypothetical protein